MTDDLRSLIRRGRDLDSLIKERSEELKQIKARLIEAGAGKYEGTDGAQALVIFPSPSIKPDDVAIASVRRLLTPKQFGRLFVVQTSYQPVKEFRGAALALLDEPKASEVIGLCQREGTAQVRFS